MNYQLQHKHKLYDEIGPPSPQNVNILLKIINHSLSYIYHFRMKADELIQKHVRILHRPWVLHQREFNQLGVISTLRQYRNKKTTNRI